MIELQEQEIIGIEAFSWIDRIGNPASDIDGDIASVKKLVSAKDLFFNRDLLTQERTTVIDDLDLTGIGVADLLRSPSNFPYYSDRTSDRFATVVERILNNNNFEIAVRTVKTTDGTSYGQNTTLRLKNVNSDLSNNYKDVLVNGSKPVVMSGGIFSTLTAWENGNSRNGLANDLVNDGHDVWEIEMNGGTNTECDTCPDYTYQDQVDYFWPALIAGVMNYSGKNKINYIGHSNGCRVALSSLNSYSHGKNNTGYTFNSETGEYDISVDLPNLPVDKFFGVACPGVLNDDTSFTSSTRVNVIPIIGPKLGYFTMDLISDPHVKMRDFTIRALPFLLNRGEISLGNSLLTIGTLIEPSEISRNLLDYYVNLSVQDSSTFVVSSVDVGKIELFNGKPSDFIVPFEDQQSILDGLTISEKSGTSISTGLFPIPLINDHASMKDNSKVKTNIREELK
ncbi:hypothetical protein J4212_04375 [Candidatus Woesearchaeota archaeon]|nr:hypothetical protein [Candidatus Woesearchaeota archaeon]